MVESGLVAVFCAGIGLASVAGVMGCFVVWRRMAYFGDSLAHSALLGIALGFMFGISTNLSIIMVALIFASLLLWLQHKKVLATDTLLGILAHSALSIGVVVSSLLGQDIDLHDYLFGNILLVTVNDLYWIYGGGALVLLLIVCNWSAMVLMTIHEDLAIAENINTFLLHILFIFLLTIVVAISIRIVGILLITSLLIIPAATARQLARSPEAMGILAALLGVTGIITGILSAIKFDTPAGPSIVVILVMIFILLSCVSYVLSYRRQISQ